MNAALDAPRADAAGGRSQAAATGGGAAAAWRTLGRWACVLGAGELLFVPAGCAHAVTNLSATAAISANFVSLVSNLTHAADELSVAGLRSPAARALAEHLHAVAERRRVPRSGALERDADDEDLPWEAFKRPRPEPSDRLDTGD